MVGVRSNEPMIERVILPNTRRCPNFVLRLLLLICVLFIACFMVLAYPLLREENVRMLLPGPSLLTWPRDAVPLDYHQVRGSRDGSSKLAALDETLLAYSAMDPNEETERRKIKMILEGSKADFENARNRYSHQGGRMDHYVDIARNRNRVRPRYETWMLQIQSPRYDGYWPRFRQLLQVWSRSRRHEPQAMAELMVTMKRNLDKFFNLEHQQQETSGSPSQEAPAGYKTCAVVGNSGILLRQSYGFFIDSHDVVIRLNNAKLRGFEDSVGSKTTVSFVNSNVYHDCSRRLNCFCHPYGNVPIVLYLCQVQHLMDIAFCEPHFDAPVLVTDPRFDLLCTRLVKWYSMKSYVEETGNPIRLWARDHNAVDFHYSSGFQAVVLALGLCEQVDILGFGKSPEAKHHYHTNQKSELGLHDYEAEYLFYDDLALNRSSSIPFLSESGIRIPPVTIYRSEKKWRKVRIVNVDYVLVVLDETPTVGISYPCDSSSLLGY